MEQQGTAARRAAIVCGFGAAVLYFAAGWLLGQCLPEQPLLCTLLQPVPVLLWAKRRGQALGLCLPKGTGAAPAVLFGALALAAVWLLPAAGSPAAGIAGVVRLCFAVPLAEELVFRGAVQGFLQPLGSRAALLTAAMLFAVQHGGAAGMLYALCMGLVLGWLRERAQSVLPCILLHSVNNLLVWLAG